MIDIKTIIELGQCLTLLDSAVVSQIESSLEYIMVIGILPFLLHFSRCAKITVSEIGSDPC